MGKKVRTVSWDDETADGVLRSSYGDDVLGIFYAQLLAVDDGLPDGHARDCMQKVKGFEIEIAKSKPNL